ncbi:sodium/proline symporter PutP [Clostridium aceticum]|uniref:Sodium/proline symporter PutP n=1 Tax=Clostridium aceticum TaxID=84022 RepID=A0A0D8I8F9_9CLOT|nr:sodium:solute symporter family protein [Clostridium aceticum]AKL95867.1 sodium/proline symporter PutP [Clostridium aceticum]KJF26543.1 symporter [Clostridium aceticum]
MNIPLIIVLVYILALFALSMHARKLAAKGSEDFLLAGRKLTTPLVAVTITGLAIGGASTIGVAEQAYNVGLAAGWYNVAWGAGAIIMGLVAAAKYRNLNVTTVPELFEKYYDTKGRIICVVGQITIQLVITALQCVSGGAILASLLPQIFTFQSGMLTSTILFVGITFIGGMMGAGFTNLLNIALIYVGIIAATLISIFSQGGLANVAAQLPPEVPYFHLTNGLGWVVIMGWFAVMVTQVMSLQATVQISCSAKDAKTARNGFILGGLLMIPIGFLSALMGIVARTIFPDISATLALPQVIMSLNPIIAGVTLAALWAAGISTGCNLLLGSATLFSQDIYKRFINPNVSEKNFYVVTKVCVAILGVFSYVAALTIVTIVQTLLVALSLTTAFTIIILFTVFAPGLCRKNSAFYTILVGIIVLVLWQFVPAIRVVPHVIYLEWIVCLITFLIIPMFDKNPVANIAATEALEN